MEYHFSTKLKSSTLSSLPWKDREQRMALSSVQTAAWCKEVKGSLWYLFIQILTHFCFSLIYVVVGFVGFFCSSQCLSPGFLSGCSLPCVGDELAQHNVWLWDVALSVSRPAMAKRCNVPCWPHLLLSTLLSPKYHKLNRPLGQPGSCRGPAKKRERMGVVSPLLSGLGLWPIKARKHGALLKLLCSFSICFTAMYGNWF